MKKIKAIIKWLAYIWLAGCAVKYLFGLLAMMATKAVSVLGAEGVFVAVCIATSVFLCGVICGCLINK